MDDINYGPVIITKGRFKDRIGIYDDDDGKKTIVYFTVYTLFSEYHLIPQSHIKKATIQEIINREDKIKNEIRLLYNNSKDFSDSEYLEIRHSLISEAHLISQQLSLQRLIWQDSSEHYHSKIKIFISYSSPDKYFAKRIAYDLEKIPSLTIWLDEWMIHGGESLITKMESGLEECDYMLILLSKNSANSFWQKKELEAKLFQEVNDNTIYVIPILIEECIIPPFLKNKKYINLTNTTADHIKYTNGITEILRAFRFHQKNKPIKIQPLR